MLTRSVFTASSKALSMRGTAVRASSNYVVLGDSQKFKDIISGDGNKILYFTATWCPPCKKIAPVFEKMSKEFTNTTFVKIDIDDFQDLAQEYRISSVPTFKAFKGTAKVSEVSDSRLCPNILICTNLL